MTDQPHRVDFHRPPKRPVEGCTINVTPAAVPGPDLTEVERTVRDIADHVAGASDRAALHVLLVEYNRRGAELARLPDDLRVVRAMLDRANSRVVSLEEELAAARSSPEAPPPLTSDEFDQLPAATASGRGPFPGADAPGLDDAPRLLREIADDLDSSHGASSGVLRLIADDLADARSLQPTPVPQVFNCDQSPHPPAQCPRCSPAGGES